jgi:hypothetical protein
LKILGPEVIERLKAAAVEKHIRHAVLERGTVFDLDIEIVQFL